MSVSLGLGLARWHMQNMQTSEFLHLLGRSSGSAGGSGTLRHQPFGRQYGVGHMGDKSVDQMG